MCHGRFQVVDGAQATYDELMTEVATMMTAAVVTEVSGAVQMQLEVPLAVTAAGVPAASGTV